MAKQSSKSHIGRAPLSGFLKKKDEKAEKAEKDKAEKEKAEKEKAEREKREKEEKKDKKDAKKVKKDDKKDAQRQAQLDRLAANLGISSPQALIAASKSPDHLTTLAKSTNLVLSCAMRLTHR